MIKRAGASVLSLLIPVSLAILLTPSLAMMQDERPPLPPRDGLAAQFPRDIGGNPLEVIAYAGQDWYEGFERQTPGSLTKLRDAVAPGLHFERSAIASAFFTDSFGQQSTLTGLRYCGTDLGMMADSAASALFPGLEDVSYLRTNPAQQMPIEMPFGYREFATSDGLVGLYPIGDTVWLLDADSPDLPEVMLRLQMAGLPAECQ